MIELEDVVIAATQTIPVRVGAGGALGANGVNSVLWLSGTGTALIPGTDPTPVLYTAIGGGKGGGPGDDGTTGGSGGGAGASYPISGGAVTAGGAGTAGQGSDGGDGHSSGGTSTCQGAAGGGGGSYAGVGGDGDATQSEFQQPEGGEGGPSTELPDFGVTAGGGGGGAAGVQDGGGDCAVFFTSGAAGSGVGAGGGGSLSGGAAGIVVVEYIGPAVSLAAPTVTSTTLVGDRVTVCVQAANWPAVEPEGYRVRIDYAVNATQPAATSGLWRTAGYLDAPGCVTTPHLPGGGKVWTRAIAEASGTLPSSPTTAVENNAPQTPGLLAHTLAIDEDGVATVTWTKNAYAGVVRIRGLIHDAAVPPANLERPLAFIADVAAATGTYTLPGVVDPDEFYSVDLEVWGTAVPPTQATPLLIDNFNRANQGGWGGAWTIRSGTTSTWEILSNVGRNDASATEVIENTAAVGGAMLIQARVFSADYATSQPQLIARFAWGGGSIEGYVWGPDPAVPGWRLQKAAAGVLTSLDTAADTLVAATTYSAQLYVADGVQQAWGNGVSAEATDTAHDGQNTRTVAARKNRLSGGQITQWDDWLTFSTKSVIVRATGLAAGWKAKVLNAASAVVAQATEVAGVATVDCSMYGGATEIIPVAGWKAVIVTNAADVELARYDPGSGIFPGLDATYVGGTLSGVGGQGTIYRVSEEQPALTGSAADLAAHLADLGNPHQVTKAQVGLGNVENTALSTWAGSANITTIGTLVAGTVPAERVSAGTFPVGAYVFQGALSGITTLAATGLISTTANIVAGHTALISFGGSTGRLQAHHAGGNAQVSVAHWSNASAGPIFAGGKSRSGTVGTFGVNALVSGDQLFNLNAYGDDGSDFNTVGGRIRAMLASTPSGPNRMPTNWAFFTAAGLADDDVSEKMRLTSTGDLAVAALAKIRPDGVAATGDTYIHESAANVLGLVAGGITCLALSSSGVAALLSAGTTTRAALRFVSGPVLTAAVAGSVEFLTDDYFLTITTGAARKGIVLDDGARLTSGRIPAATTNGRLIDGPAPAGDGTYANPTSITIVKGLITAIS